MNSISLISLTYLINFASYCTPLIACFQQQQCPYLGERIQKESLWFQRLNRMHSSYDYFKSSSSDDHIKDKSDRTPDVIKSNYGELERLKQEEQRLSRLLSSVRNQKRAVLQSRPLTIGIIGFGRFGQFIAKSFTKYGNVISTSRSDHTTVAEEYGVKYIPMSEMGKFVLDEDLDVIVIAVSIVSFENTVKELVPYLKKQIEEKGTSPLIVDVLSVKEHPRNIMLELLPEDCDILCTHPMFGPDSAKKGWEGQTFVFEKTRINKILLNSMGKQGEPFNEEKRALIGDNVMPEAFVESTDRMERFLSIWEEEGCNMIPLTCEKHDAYAANSQFITHLMGRILGAQGLQPTPIDTRGFQSVLKLIEITNTDSFDLFYGLYKYNRNSDDTIEKLRASMDDVTRTLLRKELKEARDK